MASEKIMNFVEEIKKLSVLELSELVDAIQEEFGVTAAVAAAPAAGAATAAADTPNSSSRALTSSLSSNTDKPFTSSIIAKIFSEAILIILR
mgnify:CR=1 FL=1